MCLIEVINKKKISNNERFVVYRLPLTVRRLPFAPHLSSIHSVLIQFSLE